MILNNPESVVVMIIFGRMMENVILVIFVVRHALMEGKVHAIV